MADDADRAQKRIENIEAGGISICREKAARVRALIPKNVCYWCLSWVENGKVFCDDGCMTDEAHDRLRRSDSGL